MGRPPHSSSESVAESDDSHHISSVPLTKLHTKRQTGQIACRRAAPDKGSAAIFERSPELGGMASAFAPFADAATHPIADFGSLTSRPGSDLADVKAGQRLGAPAAYGSNESHVPITIVVCASALLRESLSGILGAAGFQVAYSAANLESAIANLPMREGRALLVLEVSDRQEAIASKVRAFRKEHPSAVIALLAANDPLSDADIAAAFLAGASAYFLKPIPETFIKGLQVAMSGATVFPTAMLPFFLRRNGEADKGEVERSAAGGGPDAQAGAFSSQGAVSTGKSCILAPSIQGPPNGAFQSHNDGEEVGYSPTLSERERCVLQGLVDGESNKKIARKYGIAEATVKVYVKSVLRKIRVNNRTKAAIWAVSHSSAEKNSRP